MRPGSSFIGQPIRSLQTMLRVLAEDDPSHPTVIPDGIYGPETTGAVSRFQRIHGLPVTGITDQATWEAIVLQFDEALIRVGEAWPVHIALEPGQVIRRGDEHPHLHLVQAMLTVLSNAYDSIPAPGKSGVLDDATADSLGEFQRLSGLPMTGHLDKKTWKHLALQYPLAAGTMREGPVSRLQNISRT